MTNNFKGYNPNRSAEWNYGGRKWRLSRSKIELFIECPRCFYLDNKLGTKRPSFPSFTLNIAVDQLLKNEFDSYREKQTAHPIMKKNHLNMIPFQHPDLDRWRDNFAGLEYKEPKTGLTVSGAVDDVWINNENELVVVDYKATAKEGEITTLKDSAWEEAYRRQMGIYQWILKKMGFKVSDMGYFLYTNALLDGYFEDRLRFKSNLIACSGDTQWIDDTLIDIKNCLDSEFYPESSPNCEYCQYRMYSGKKLQAIHKNKKS